MRTVARDDSNCDVGCTSDGSDPWAALWVAAVVCVTCALSGMLHYVRVRCAVSVDLGPAVWSH